MEIRERTRSLAESAKQIRIQQYTNAGLAGVVLLLSGALFMQDKIIIQQIPGMANDLVVRKNSMDKSGERAVLLAVTSNIAQINPANAGYQKAFLQAFLSPAAYTRISREIDARVKQLAEQRELGSYYFVFRRAEYDPAIDKHFIVGDVHTVNAAKDTALPYVFEYKMHVENYRPVIDDMKTYEGDRAHNSAWIKEQQK